jgi:hypothetical protein
MEDYIYILLALLWVVFSVIKATRKKPLPPVAEVDEYEETENEPRSTFDDLLEEFLGTESYERKQAKKTQSDFEPEVPLTFTPEIEKYEELLPIIDDGDEMIEPIQVIDGDLSNEAGLTTGDMTKAETDNSLTFKFRSSEEIAFDLRKAILFSAVLHRPYD